MRCIICLKPETVDRVFTEEHIFPDAIGGRVVLKSMCKPCNDRLGNEVDCLLTNHWLIQGQRMLLKIPGKSGKIPNPIERGTLKENAGHKLMYIMDADGEHESLYSVTSVERTPAGDGKEIVSVRVDKSDLDKLPSIVNKIRKRAGLPPMTKEEVEAAQQAGAVPSPWMVMNVAIDFAQYQRAMLKIAYELACRWLGEKYLDDPSAKLLRECLFDPIDDEWHKRYPICHRFEIGPEPPAYPFWRDGTKSHIGFAMPIEGGIAVYVRVFEVFEGKVLVSTDAAAYRGFAGMFVANNPTSGVVREVPLLTELARLGRTLG